MPPLPAVVAVAVLVAVAAITAVLLLADGQDEPVVLEPTATPTATEPEPTPTTPTPTPTPTPEPTPEAEPFEVRLVEEDGLGVITTDNAAILSRASLDTDGEVAQRAAEIARAALEDFLNAQFTDRETWFGAAPIEGLLTPHAVEALDEGDRAALGQVDLGVDHVVTGQAQADAMVTMHGDSPRNVTLDFTASLTVVSADATETPLRLEGTMLFVPTEGGWLVEAVDSRLRGEGEA